MRLPVQGLAAEYPQRLYFPFQLSRHHWGVAGRRRAEVLAPPLRSAAMESFATALHDTTYPFQRLEGWLAEFRPLVKSGDKVRIIVRADVLKKDYTRCIREIGLK